VIAELLAVVAMSGPSAEPAACAVTQSALPSRRHGGKALWTTLPEDGVINARPRDDGSLFWKFGWTPKRQYPGGLAVTGRRLDAAAPPMTVLAVRWGYSSTGRGSWATAVNFPTAGCWRITGRSAGVKLSYVVRVVAA